jgi:hypothetical protein
MSRANRLHEVEQKCIRKPRIQLLWVDARDTPADIEANRQRLIAGGRARPDDEFVHVRWKQRGES